MPFFVTNVAISKDFAKACFWRGIRFGRKIVKVFFIEGGN